MAGHHLVVVDDLRRGHIAALARAQGLSGRTLTHIHADIATGAAMAHALADVDAVIHLAAWRRVDESMEAPERTFHNNLGGMSALLQAMETAGVRRLLYSSSAAVYGRQDRMPVVEDAPLQPESPYGWSKAAGEEMLGWMARQRGWSAVSLRYFNPVGAHPSGLLGEPPCRATALLPRALLALLPDQPPLTIFGTDYPTPDGTCLRDYIHIEDLAAAHQAALGRLDRPGVHEIYNVGTGRPHSVRELLDSCAGVVGRPVPSVEGARRPGDIAISYADPTRFQTATGFLATRSLDQMVASAWAWYHGSPHGFGPPKEAG